MSASDATALALDPEHCRAISEEIGARLRCALPPVTSDPPARIVELLARLAELDHDAPSIVPSIGQMEIGEAGQSIEAA